MRVYSTGYWTILSGLLCLFESRNVVAESLWPTTFGVGFSRFEDTQGKGVDRSSLVLGQGYKAQFGARRYRVSAEFLYSHSIFRGPGKEFNFNAVGASLKPGIALNRARTFEMGPALVFEKRFFLKTPSAVSRTRYDLAKKDVASVGLHAGYDLPTIARHSSLNVMGTWSPEIGKNGEWTAWLGFSLDLWTPKSRASAATSADAPGAAVQPPSVFKLRHPSALFSPDKVDTNERQNRFLDRLFLFLKNHPKRWKRVKLNYLARTKADTVNSRERMSAIGKRFFLEKFDMSQVVLGKNYVTDHAYLDNHAAGIEFEIQLTQEAPESFGEDLANWLKAEGF